MKRQFLALLFGTLGGTLLAYTFHGPEDLWIGAGLGAFIGILIINFEAFLNSGISWIRQVSLNRYWLMSAGAIFGGSSALVLSTALLASIGWIGSCWG
jgi:hypothetical protein